MKKAKTSIGRKLLGSFVTMALVFGMLPGMLTTADVEEDASTDGVVSVDVTPSSNVTASAPATIEGITLSVPRGQSEGIQMPNMAYNGKRFQVARNNTSSFNFSINDRAGFANGQIVKIEIAVSSVTGISSHGGTEGWDGDLAAGTFTWAGDAAKSVDLTFTGNNSYTHRVAFTAITVYVEVPVTSVAITGVPAGPVVVGQTVELGVQVQPSNTTYSSFDIECSDNASFELIVDEGVATLYVTIEAEGIVSISASLGGVADENYIFAYQPVDSVGIAPESLELTTEDDPATVIVYTEPETDVYDVEWSIGDESVATIDVAEDALSAVVTPIGVGETTITAVFYSVEYEDGLELTCAVSVTEPEPEPGPEPAPEEPALTPEQIQRMAVEHFVERLYVEALALGRQFDKNGRDAWADILMAGGSASAVARGFFGSQEFLNRNLTNEEFVTILYKVFYDSVPETGSYTNYVDALYNGMMTRSEVIDNFVSSYEWASFCARYAVNV